MQEATLKMFKGPRWVLKSSHCSLLLASCGKVRVVWKRKSLHASIGKLGRSLQRPKITCEGCDGGVFRGQSYYEQCIGWHVREMWHALWSKGIVNRIQNWDIVVRSTRVVSYLFQSGFGHMAYSHHWVFSTWKGWDCFHVVPPNDKPWWRAKFGYISYSPYYMHSYRSIGREPIMFGCIEKSLWYHSAFRAFYLYDWFIQSCRLLR